MSQHRRVFALAITGVVALAVTGAIAAAVVGTRHQPVTTTVPVIVELFTSEGCSSCPPADQLLIDLIAKQPVKEALVIGLSEHVDYWDHQGWKDPFSDHAFTGRQSAYAAAGGLTDIYTPQVIVDGVGEAVGNDRGAVVAAIRRAATRPKRSIALAWSGGGDGVSIGVDPAPETANSTVFLAITEDSLRTSVKRGENAGRTLDHTAVTRRLIQVGKTDKDGKFMSVVPIALDQTWKRQNTRVVVFVQSDATRRINAVAVIGA